MNKNKKELIIESFQKMDLNMLDILLDENRTYQDATKEVFLEKLNIVFSKLKNNGDTLLSTYEGFCNSDACHNKSCKGYSFVGNKSKKHIDLIFEELDNDVKDICHCNGFKTYETFVETENLIMIDVKNDEKADFKPSINFLIISQKCKLAYEELIHYQNKIIDKEVYLTWLAKHHSLYDSIIRFSSYYSEIDKFYWLYNRMEEMKEFLQSSNAAKEAIETFQTIDKNNTQELLKWLVKYEETGENLTLFLYDYYYSETNEFYEVDILKVDKSDYIYIKQFKFLFDEHYWEMLKKYSTFSEEETKRYINENDEMSKHISSLSYHLDKKGIHL